MDVFPTDIPEKSRILLAEDSTIVRSTICALLENDGMARIASATNFDDALDLVQSDGPFDLVLLDYNMPGMEGLSGLDRMIAANGEKPVGLISAGMPSELVEEAVTKGASGFIPKVLAPRMIVQAIRMMSEGQKFHPNHFLNIACPVD